MSADGLHNFWLFFVQNIKTAYFYEITITNRKHPTSNPLQEGCSGFPIATRDSKSCSESRL
jgi:hypothetical protein